MEDVEIKAQMFNKTVINLVEMEKKVYEDMIEFKQDLKWFVFYCRVKYAKNSIQHQGAIALLKFVPNEIASILVCEECFLNAHEHGPAGFVIPCKLPHLLLWTKLDDYSFWPSKAMWVEETQKFVTVRFFGNHSTSTLSSKCCVLFSKVRPKEAESNELVAYQLAMAVSQNILEY